MLLDDPMIMCGVVHLNDQIMGMELHTVYRMIYWNEFVHLDDLILNRLFL